MAISLTYLILLLTGNLIYFIKNSRVVIQILGRKISVPQLPYPDLILNSSFLWVIAHVYFYNFSIVVIASIHTLVSLFFLTNRLQKLLLERSIDFNAISSTIFFCLSCYLTDHLVFLIISTAFILLFARNVIGSLIHKVSLIEFDGRIKYFSGYFLGLQIVSTNAQEIIILSVVYFFIETFTAFNSNIDQFSKRISGTNKIVTKHFNDFQKYLLVISLIALILSDESTSILISDSILVYATLSPLAILYENILGGLHISSDRRKNIIRVDGTQYTKDKITQNINISKGLAKANYSTYYIDKMFYVNFLFGFYPQKITASKYFSSLNNRNIIYINFIGNNLTYNSLYFKEFKEQYLVQKYIAKSKNEIKNSIHISEDLDESYDFNFSIEEYIAKNHLLSAAKYSSLIKSMIQENGIFIRDIYNKGVFDLNIMHKRNASVGDLSLRLFANLNFIEISTRFIVVLASMLRKNELDLSNQISFGLMVSKLRDLGVSGLKKHDTSSYYDIMKTALRDLKHKGKLPVNQTLDDLLNTATFIRNKTQGHGSALHISEEIWMTSELISYHVLSFIQDFFGSIYFYKRTGENLFEARSGLLLKQNISLNCHLDYFIRINRESFNSKFLLPHQDYWYIID